MSETGAVKLTGQEHSPELTVRSGVGTAVDPRSTQPLNISNIISQQQEAVSIPPPPPLEPASSSEETHKIPRPKLDDPPLRVQQGDQPAAAAGPPQWLPVPAELPRQSRWKWPLALGAGVVILVTALLVFFRGSGSQPAVARYPAFRPSAGGPVPDAARAYFDKAKVGDVYAMRMLGVMYYNGLDVPQDREQGLYWYRQAAERGSEAARSELSKIEGGR